MSKGKNFIFIALHVVAWLIFIGLCIEAGGLLVNFVFSVFKPEMVSRLYTKIDLSSLYAKSPEAFYGMYSFALTISIMKSVLFYFMIILLLKLDLANPFSPFVASKISQISYITFVIGMLSYVAQQSSKTLGHHGYDTGELSQFWVDSQAFILMAAIVYIIATIFKRGVELQTENELTV